MADPDNQETYSGHETSALCQPNVLRLEVVDNHRGARRDDLSRDPAIAVTARLWEGGGRGGRAVSIREGVESRKSVLARLGSRSPAAMPTRRTVQVVQRLVSVCVLLGCGACLLCKDRAQGADR